MTGTFSLLASPPGSRRAWVALRDLHVIKTLSSLRDAFWEISYATKRSLGVGGHWPSLYCYIETNTHFTSQLVPAAIRLPSKVIHIPGWAACRYSTQCTCKPDPVPRQA